MTASEIAETPWPAPDPNRDYVTFAPDDDDHGYGPWVAMDSLGSVGTRFPTEAEALAYAHRVHFQEGT
jgi:hypothetical protein